MRILSRFKAALSTLLFILILFSASSITALADEDGIRAIDVIVNLNTDGSADITEVWSIDNAYDGTEYYINMNNMENMIVSDLTVTDDTGTVYETLSSWDTKASFKEKAYKCGILETTKGYELCWGISQMGDRVYTVEYHLTGLVKGYSDTDGFYHQFITHDLSSEPQSASVTLLMNEGTFTSNNTQVWAFGFTGEVTFSNGSIQAFSTDELSSSDYVRVLVEFEKGIFTPVTASGTFEAVKNKAFNKDKSDAMVPFFLLGVAVASIILITIIITITTRNIKLADGSKIRRISLKKSEPTSSLPFDNNIPAVCRASTIDYGIGIVSPIAAYLVKWQLAGCIQFDEEQTKHKNKTETVIKFIQEPTADLTEKSLYEMMQAASTDNSLGLNQWAKWLEKNYPLLDSWNKDLETTGKTQLVNAGLVVEVKKDKLRFTATGYKKYLRLQGFYMYLKGFKKPSGDLAAPRQYWDDYLIYAALFNLTEGVTKGLKEFDAEGFDDYCLNHNMDTYFFLMYMNHSSSFANHTQSADAISSGGGGFSGGGGGGGSR